MRLLLVGLIVPHAPVLLPEVRGAGRSDPRLAPKEQEAPLCVLISPHGESTGVYRRVRGNLDGFGIRGIDVERRTDRAFGKELARAWERPLLDVDPDHGVLVPLLIAVPGALSVVAATFAEVTGPGGGSIADVRRDAEEFARAIAELSADRDLIVAASAHTSAALSPGAPLTERPEGHELEKRVTEALETDLGLLGAIEDELWTSSGACGAGPLIALGHLFGGRTATVTFREAPFGVGYLLAQTA